MIKDGNYITITGQMLKTGLTGNKLLVYAVIYGFCQDENSVFYGTTAYLAEWLNATKRTIINILQELTADGYIIKTESVVNGVRTCEYKIADRDIEKVSPESVKNFPTGGESFSKGVVKNFPKPGEKFAPNNNIDIIDNNNLVESTRTTPKKVKLRFGECGSVALTREEFEKIVDKYGWYTEAAINILDRSIASSGKDPYKEHYPVFNKYNWLWREAFKYDENGLPPRVLTILDPFAPNGARKETPLEYYTKYYNLDEQGKETSDVGEKKDMHISD
jgi:hypothetical protein